jgi:hypothetical protein
MLQLGYPKRSCKVLSLSEKVKIPDLIRKGKKLYAEVAKIFRKSIHEIAKKEKFMLALPLHLKLENL